MGRPVLQAGQIVSVGLSECQVTVSSSNPVKAPWGVRVARRQWSVGVGTQRKIVLEYDRILHLLRLLLMSDT